MFLMYVKQHTEAFLIDRRVSRPATTPQKAQGSSNLEGQLEHFFKQNPDRLIRMPEVTKALGGKSKSAARFWIFLERSDWCKVVDGTTFFYSSGT